MTTLYPTDPDIMHDQQVEAIQYDFDNTDVQLISPVIEQSLYN
jgi:predicted HAD superfamily phosphohydrolase YqeG